MSTVPPVFFAWTGTGRHGDDLVSTVSPAHTSPSPPLSESEPPLYLGVCVCVPITHLSSPSLSDGSEDSLKALIHARQRSRGAT